MNQFILSCGSTMDMPYSYVSGRNIPVAFYSYMVDDKEFPDDMLRDPEATGKVLPRPQYAEIYEKKYAQYRRIIEALAPCWEGLIEADLSIAIVPKITL